MFVFLFGIIVGICLVWLFFGHQDRPATIVTGDPGHARAKLAEAEHHYQTKIDSLEQINTSLQSSVSKTQVALGQAKKQNRSLHSTIKDLLTVHYSAPDTITKLSNCDSLAITVDYLLAQTTTKDSLSENLTNTLQAQVTVRDSLISLQHTQYDSLQTSFKRALVQQEALIQQNTVQQKAIRKQKRGKGLLTAMLLVVGGLFVHSAIK